MTNYHFIRKAVNRLFDKEDQYLKERALSLIPKNAQLGRSPDGFRHLGIVYTRTGGQCDLLHHSLVPELDQILEEQRAHEKAKVKVRQALAIALQGCKTWQEVRNAIPNGLAVLMEETAHLERTEPEAEHLRESNPQAYTQYMSLRDHIEYQVASQMLY